MKSSAIGLCTSFLVGSYFLLLFFQSQFAEAQLPVNLTKIIEEKFPEKTISAYSPYPFNSVEVKYESPTTILIKGDLIYSEFNKDIWTAMDILKNQYGFTLQQVMTSGEGSVQNPTVVYILMTK